MFSVGTNAAVNANNDTYIAYCFSEIEGFSKFGSYTGNGSADGPFVYCGFRPRWVMIKSAIGTAQEWGMQDAARSTSNQCNLQLRANASTAEGDNGTRIDMLSNGFKLRTLGDDSNGNTFTYIFAAFAESPFKYARAR